MRPGMIQSDYILGVIRTLSLVPTLAVCLGGGLRSPSAFLVLYWINVWQMKNPPQGSVYKKDLL